MSEAINRLISVVHSHNNTRTIKLVYLHINRDFRGICWLKDHCEGAWFFCNIIGSFVLVPEGVSTNNNGLGPAWDKSWNIFYYDRFSEHCSVKLVADSSIWTLPHLLQLELNDSCLVWCYGGALYSDLARFNRGGSLESYFVICFVSVFHSEVKVLDVYIKVG